MNWKQVLIIVAVVFIVAEGCVIGYFISRKPEIVIVKKDVIKWKPAQRDYKKMTCDDMQKELLRYDTEIPRLDGVMSGDVFTASAGLADRNWSRDFKMKSGMNKKDRDLMIGLTVVGFAVGFASGAGATYGIMK